MYLTAVTVQSVILGAVLCLCDFRCALKILHGFGSSLRYLRVSELAGFSIWCAGLLTWLACTAPPANEARFIMQQLQAYNGHGCRLARGPTEYARKWGL